SITDTSPPELYTLSLHDALPISGSQGVGPCLRRVHWPPDYEAGHARLANEGPRHLVGRRRGTVRLRGDRLRIDDPKRKGQTAAIWRTVIRVRPRHSRHHV